MGMREGQKRKASLGIPNGIEMKKSMSFLFRICVWYKKILPLLIQAGSHRHKCCKKILDNMIIFIFILLCPSSRSSVESINSQLIPGPSTIVYNDGNETITVDFSDVEFYPVESFPLFTSNQKNISEGLHVASTTWERKIIKQLIGALDLDYMNGIKAGRIISASDLPQLLSPPGHPLHQGTPDYTKAYGISSLGGSNFYQKKFTTIAVEADFGNGNKRHYSMVRYQNRVKFGRKIIRFAMWQSLNQDKPRHIWLTDAHMWRESSLTPLGRMMTPAGYAILWTL